MNEELNVIANMPEGTVLFYSTITQIEACTKKKPAKITIAVEDRRAQELMKAMMGIKKSKYGCFLTIYEHEQFEKTEKTLII